MSTQPNNPTHGITLEAMLSELVQAFGWPELGRRIQIRCFNFDPSLKSSLTFLRRTPWARAELEQLYLQFKRGDGAARPPTRLFAAKRRSAKD